MGRFKKFAVKFGFTELELQVLLFVIVVFLIGLAAYYFKYLSEMPVNAAYDYYEQDSMFFSNKEIEPEELKLLEKKVDSKQELLDFSVDKLSSESAQNSALAEESININTADVVLLKQLPGIGYKTAEKIIELRNNLGLFTSLDQLLKVKGIGEVKFNRIVKYLYIGKKNTLNPLEEE